MTINIFFFPNGNTNMQTRQVFPISFISQGRFERIVSRLSNRSIHRNRIELPSLPQNERSILYNLPNCSDGRWHGQLFFIRETRLGFYRFAIITGNTIRARAIRPSRLGRGRIRQIPILGRSITTLLLSSRLEGPFNRRIFLECRLLLVVSNSQWNLFCFRGTLQRGIRHLFPSNRIRGEREQRNRRSRHFHSSTAAGSFFSASLFSPASALPLPSTSTPFTSTPSTSTPSTSTPSTSTPSTSTPSTSTPSTSTPSTSTPSTSTPSTSTPSTSTPSTSTPSTSTPSTSTPSTSTPSTSTPSTSTPSTSTPSTSTPSTSTPSTSTPSTSTPSTSTPSTSTPSTSALPLSTRLISIIERMISRAMLQITFEEWNLMDTINLQIEAQEQFRDYYSEIEQAVGHENVEPPLPQQMQQFVTMRMPYLNILRNIIINTPIEDLVCSLRGNSVAERQRFFAICPAQIFRNLLIYIFCEENTQSSRIIGEEEQRNRRSRHSHSRTAAGLSFSILPFPAISTLPFPEFLIETIEIMISQATLQINFEVENLRNAINLQREAQMQLIGNAFEIKQAVDNGSLEPRLLQQIQQYIIRRISYLNISRNIVINTPASGVISSLRSNNCEERQRFFSVCPVHLLRYLLTYLLCEEREQ